VPKTPEAALARSLLAWYRRHGRDLPWRRTRDPYRVWVSEVMLQQTTVRAVVPYYRRFLGRFPTLRALARAPLPRVLAAWSGLGYYRRARHLHAAARIIVKDHAGRFPSRPDQVRALPGVGRYTAGALLSIVFGRQEPVVDGNVARVLSRLFLMRGDARGRASQERLWDLARGLVRAAPADPGDLNQALMELGATLCSPLAPRCPLCPVARRCRARAAGAQEAIPGRRRARAPVDLAATLVLVARRGRFLMHRRRRTGLMDGLWEFPALEGDQGAAGAAVSGDLRLEPLERVATLRHTITYRRLRIEVRRARLLSEPRGRDYRWVSPAGARRLPASSLVAKVLGSLPPGQAPRHRV